MIIEIKTTRTATESHWDDAFYKSKSKTICCYSMVLPDSFSAEDVKKFLESFDSSVSFGTDCDILDETCFTEVKLIYDDKKGEVVLTIDETEAF